MKDFVRDPCDDEYIIIHTMYYIGPLYTGHVEYCNLEEFPVKPINSLLPLTFSHATRRLLFPHLQNPERDCRLVQYGAPLGLGKCRQCEYQWLCRLGVYIMTTWCYLYNHWFLYTTGFSSLQNCGLYNTRNTYAKYRIGSYATCTMLR